MKFVEPETAGYVYDDFTQSRARTPIQALTHTSSILSLPFHFPFVSPHVLSFLSLDLLHNF